MTPLDLPGLRALLAAGTPGPWSNGADPSHFDSPEVTDDKTFAYYVTTDADAKLITAAVNALPSLLDRLDALEGELAVYRKSFPAGIYDRLEAAETHAVGLIQKEASIRADERERIAEMVVSLGGKATADAMAFMDDGTWRVIASVHGDIAETIRSGLAATKRDET